MTLHKRYYTTLALGLSVLTSTGYSLPFTITPIGSLPTTYPAIASYSITKNTAVGASGNIVKWLPPNVSISPTGTTCATSVNQAFTLAYQQSCVLNLLVSGSVSSSDGNPDNHLMVCLSDRVSCAGPNPANSINVSAAAPRQNYIAVGEYNSDTPQSGSQYPLSYVTNDGGNSWALSASLPENQSTGTGIALVSGLKGATCDSTGKNCVSVGSFIAPYESGEQTYPLAYFSRDGGNTWLNPTTQPPLPTVDVSGGNLLNGVSCSSDALSCVAVGSYNASYYPLSYYTTDGGDNWYVSSQLPPPEPSAYNEQSLASVACSNNGLVCTTVGFYQHVSTYLNVPFSYTTTDGGNIWNSSDAMPNPPEWFQSVLNGVACDSSGLKCTAVGYYNTESFETLPLSYVSTDGGHSWNLSHSYPPSHDGYPNYVQGVACGSTGDNCVAVGYYGNAEPSSYVSIDGGNTWNFSTELPLPTTSFGKLLSVVCDSSGLICTAGGYYNTHSDHTLPLTYYSTDGGVHWAMSTTPPPAINNLANKLAAVG